jgi:hypothetical protein
MLIASSKENMVHTTPMNKGDSLMCKEYAPMTSTSLDGSLKVMINASKYVPMGGDHQVTSSSRSINPLIFIPFLA